MDKKFFEIIKDYRKIRIIKHRKKKYIPPISIETRRMSRRKNISERELLDVEEEISFPKVELLEE